MKLVTFFILTAAHFLVPSECLTNPVFQFPQGFFGLSVNKYNGGFYLLITTTNITLFSSRDLKNWGPPITLLSALDLGQNLPKSLDDSLFDTAELYISPENEFFLYYRTTKTSACIGVAKSKKISGPYLILNNQLLCHATHDHYFEFYNRFPSILLDQEERLLMYTKFGEGEGALQHFEARYLSKDGLSLAGENPTRVILAGSSKNTGSNAVRASPIFQRYGMYYMIHSGSTCSKLYVARSFDPVGVFVSHDDVLVGSETGFYYPFYCGIVKDRLGNDILLYSTSVDVNDTCAAKMDSVSAVRLEWGPDQWPFVVEEDILITDVWEEPSNIEKEDDVEEEIWNSRGDRDRTKLKPANGIGPMLKDSFVLAICVMTLVL